MSDDISYEAMDEKEGEELSPKDKIKKLREELEMCKRERQEYLDGWQRVKADFVNARKQEEAARVEIVKYASAHVIEDMLEVLDTFDMAFAHKEAWEKVDRNWRIGVESIYQKMISQLESHGIKKIEPKVGEKFDPGRHQSVAAVPTEGKDEDDTIAVVTQPGYQLHDKLLRPAKVKVAHYEETSS